jgi:ribonuclease J
MKITIHRGIDRIGGCITEIATDRTRILIDLGQNLPDGEGGVNDEMAVPEAIERLTHGVDAIFYTHYHGDHIGLFHLVPKQVPQYMGAAALKVTVRKHAELARIPDQSEVQHEAMRTLGAMRPFEERERITVGDIVVTPYFVSHSACDAYMFLIEAGGRRILHTGDFRGHGYLSKGTLPAIEQRILSGGAIDLLITEGTMLSRAGEKVLSEPELRQQIEDVMRRHKYVFAMCSSTDMERLASFADANRRMGGRMLVGDSYQYDILEIFTDTKSRHSSLFDFGEVSAYDYPDPLLAATMLGRGFCMFVRASSKSNKFTALINYLKYRGLDLSRAVLIYSMWGEYAREGGRHAKKEYLEFLRNFPNVEKLHTSGHATPEFLAEVCRAVNPVLGIVPIHSERSADYANLPIGEALAQKTVTSSTTVGDVTIEIVSVADGA